MQIKVHAIVYSQHAVNSYRNTFNIFNIYLKMVQKNAKKKKINIILLIRCPQMLEILIHKE